MIEEFTVPRKQELVLVGNVMSDMEEGIAV